MKFLIFIAFLIFIYWYFLKRKKKLSYNKSKELFEELVFDENCQTYVKKEEAIKLKIEGKDYYFCSQKCLYEFLKKTSKPQP
uniref:YHS domain-containing protein n=1 Tax=Thermodesulfobacterium geofontis TaxID=1295609 RepID=A0A7V4JQT7_9BACT